MTSAVPVLPPLVASLLSPLPLMPLQPVLSVMLAAVVERHPRVFVRLGEHASKRFGIDPSDLPFAFLLEPQPDSPRVRAVRSISDAQVRIAGPLAALVGLVQGTYDGDALFFSRDIIVEGDVEAALALRNTIDDVGIDLVAAMVAGFGPISGVAARAVHDALAAIRSLGRWRAHSAEAIQWS